MTRAIDALLSIMQNPDTWLGRRIEAADGLLSFEAPAEYVEAAKAFLTEVFVDPEQDDEFRMKALKLVRKVEARKVVAPTTPQRSDREGSFQQRRAQRRLALVQAGLWPAPAGWDADLTEVPQVGALDEQEGMAGLVKRARVKGRRKPC